VRDDGERIIVEVPKKITDPAGFLWSLSEKSMDVDHWKRLGVEIIRPLEY